MEARVSWLFKSKIEVQVQPQLLRNELIVHHLFSNQQESIKARAVVRLDVIGVYSWWPATDLRYEPENR